jgi:two-component system, OmpR family, response regulator
MIKTFIVEDSPVIRENLIATLEEMVPLKVVGWADSARSAVEWLQSGANDCDLVIVDLFLRQGSGMQVLQQLAEHAHAADRVVLTNYATPDVRSQCLKLGASRVFDKSGEIDALIDHCLQMAHRHAQMPRAPGGNGLSAA